MKISLTREIRRNKIVLVGCFPCSQDTAIPTSITWNWHQTSWLKGADPTRRSIPAASCRGAHLPSLTAHKSEGSHEALWFKNSLTWLTEIRKALSL